MEFTGGNQSTFKYGLVMVVTSGFGVLASCAILAILLCTRSYKTFLQRNFMWIILTILIVDVCRTASFGYQYSDNILTLQDSFCEILAFVSMWLDWCTYILCSVLISYLLFLVCTQTRGDSAIVTRLKSSRTLRVLLELGIFVGTLLLPATVLWVPYHLNAYGFDGTFCKFRPKVPIYYDIFVYTLIRELTGIFTIVSAIGMAVVYCSMSRSLQNARRVVKNLLIVVVLMIIYTIVLNLAIIILRSLQPEDSLAGIAADRCLQTIGKFVLIVGYLLVFHFGKFCEPIKKLVKETRRNEEKNKQHTYKTFRDSSRESAPSFTFFENPYTGQFTTISKV